VLWACLLRAKVASNWLEIALDAIHSSRRLIVSNDSRKQGKCPIALCCGGCRFVLSVGLAFVSTLATASAKLVHISHNCCLQRPFEMTVCHKLILCMQRLECNQHQSTTAKCYSHLACGNVCLCTLLVPDQLAAICSRFSPERPPGQTGNLQPR